MRRLCFLVLLSLLSTPQIFADTQDTAVFQTRMIPDNEVPPVSAQGNSGTGTITVRVTRDGRGNVNAATVTFDIDYTITSAATFTGLHIHNAPLAQNGPVFIDAGITPGSPVSAAAGSGRISRVVNYAAAETLGLRYVTGLLATPENYYVNIHTTTNPGGFMRGQLMPTRLVFRPVMSTAFEVPVINLDAEGAARVEVNVTRNLQTGAITSGTVIFDVDYRFPAAVTLTGLHIHNGPLGANGPVVIDSGINGNTRSIAGATRGNVFRIAEIDSSNTNGIAALTGLFNDPAQYYINLHTTANPGGVIRGQLSRNFFAFFNLMTQAEENPPTGVASVSNSMTYVLIERDSTGNIAAGSVSFNLNYNMGGPITFTGLHIHNGKFAANGSVVINTGIPQLVDDDGFGSVNREVTIDSSNATALDSMRGLLENPELYYVNIHSTQFPGGVIRSQLARETYNFKANMSTANEVPPITTADTAATAWITAKISRDANGAVNGGEVTFDVNYTNTGAITFTGLHIHHPGAAGINGSVTINAGLSATNTVENTAGSGNITRTAAVPSTSATGIAALNALISAPETAYVNLHSTQFPGGVVRSQMFPTVNTVAQTAGGGEWISSITIRNPSTTAAVQGILDLFQSSGAAIPEAISNPNLKFLIPPSGSATFSTHNKGTLTVGYAKVFSNGNVTVEARYLHPGYTASATSGTTVTSRSLSVPVAAGATAAQNTGVSLLANSAGTLTLTLTNSTGGAIAGGSRSLEVTAGQHVLGFVKDLLPGVTATQFTGTLTITTSAGTISAIGLQFNGTLAPLSPTALP